MDAQPIANKDPLSTAVGDLWRPFGTERGTRPLISVWDGDAYLSWSWADWQHEASRAAGALHRLGVRAGDPVACVLGNSPAACAAVLGVWLAGGHVLSLPLPARGMSGEAYAAQLRTIVARTAPVLVLADGDLAGGVASLELGPPVAAFQALEGDPLKTVCPPGADAAAFVQFSSGSTMTPKGCVLTPRAIAAQLEALRLALPIDPERDTGVNWLPLSHDMGLFGCVLLAYWTGHHNVHGTPQRFLARPVTWLEDMARFGGTCGASPPFALSLVARRLRAPLPGRLAMRKLVVGGERIDPPGLGRFVDALDGALEIGDLMPSYGLAEAVLAVAMTRDGGPRLRTVDADALAAGTVADATAGPDGRAIALCGSGTPVPGAFVRIDAPPGADVGEIVVGGESLASGYLADPERTAARFGPEGVRTGDLGFVDDDGHLFVTGRLDDLITVGGRNVYARDMEVAAATIDGVREGRCAVVALGEADDHALVALIESDLAGDARTDVARQVRAAAIRQVGVGIDSCLFVDAGRLPKTPSGKIQRFRCRALASEELDRAGAVHLTTGSGR